MEVPMDEIEAAGQRVVEAFGACAGAPDDLDAARAADDALDRLEELLTARSDR
jgi:hypothetical protein